MSGWRAPLTACLALAAELAAEWKIVTFPAPEAATWASLLADDDQRDNRPEMALDIVREYLAAHADKLWGNKGDDEPPPPRDGSAATPRNARPSCRKTSPTGRDPTPT